MRGRNPGTLALLTVACLGLALLASLMVFHRLHQPGGVAQSGLLGWFVVGEASAIAAVALLLMARDRTG